MSIVDNLGEGFDKAATLLKGTMNNMRQMMKTKHGNQCMTVLGFIVAIFVLMEVFRSLTSARSPSTSRVADVKFAENGSKSGRLNR